MQKLLSTALLLLSMVILSAAQNTPSSDLYLMKSSKDAEYVLKAINLQLHLSETDFNKVKDLLIASSVSQQEQLRSFTEQERVNIIKTRQTAHIENTLRSIVGPDKYAIYLNKKADIEAKLKELKKN